MAKGLTRYDELEAAIDRAAGSYDLNREIDNLESAALPSRRAVIEALNHLQPAIYLGFYSTRPLRRGNLRYAISEHLYPAYEILVEQISRAVQYEQECCRATVVHDAGWPEDVVMRLFDKLPELRAILNDDVVAAFEGDPAAQSVEEVIFSYPAIQAITTHRIAHELYREQVPMIPRILSEHAHGKTGIDIHPGAQIGRSFFIDHGTGVVVGETSVIGDNVKLYQGVTLGALSPRRQEGALFRNRKRHPTLENNVTIYSGATILGDTVIGEGSVIGGNVWLVESVPPHSRVSYNAHVTHSHAADA
ncbi:MAG TPA: serine O-acetyltransferase EpsC [Candidatus Acidoferrales bacterium]|nr:serine O-acetyltransferase EpsC [Candidatus Acidoferrales bacterium]